MKVSKEFKEFFNEFHEKFPSGNFLHIATSDGNWETKHIVWCLMHWLDYADYGEKEWLKEHEEEIINMCSKMLDMTERQRFKIWDAVKKKEAIPISRPEEKWKPKKVLFEDVGYNICRNVNVYACICPDCGLHIFEFTDDDVDDKCDSDNPEVMFRSSMVHHGYIGLGNFCERCGRRLDWGDYHKQESEL